jgi:hypothetical protein
VAVPIRVKETVMTRDEVLARLVAERSLFDAKVAAVPPGSLDKPMPGSTHSAKDVVSHVTAYEELIVERLVAARHGAKTSFERDRAGWETYNERTWSEASSSRARAVLRHSEEVFANLLRQVGSLSDEELNAPMGATASLDPAWLESRPPWQLIAIDAFEHYRMHFEALDAAAAAAKGHAPQL